MSSELAVPDPDSQDARRDYPYYFWVDAWPSRWREQACAWNQDKNYLGLHFIPRNLASALHMDDYHEKPRTGRTKMLKSRLRQPQAMAC
jgi:hypothetical protein